LRAGGIRSWQVSVLAGATLGGKNNLRGYNDIDSQVMLPYWTDRAAAFVTSINLISM